MASWQAHVTSWILKWQLKPKLAKATTAMEVRRLMKPRAVPVPEGVRITQEIVGGVPGEWVESGPGPTLLYLHGGGYVACTAKMFRPITMAFAQKGLRVFAPDYRLAPESLFPAAVQDAVAVYRALGPGPVVVAGDSAGGGLALAMVLSLRMNAVPLPRAMALFSPWTDLAATGESLVTNDKKCAMFRGKNMELCAGFYLGSADARNPMASPLYADLAGMPPMLIHVGANEVLLDDSRRLAEKARAAGVKVELKVWPVVPHDWQLVPTMPEARESMREAVEFLHG